MHKSYRPGLGDLTVLIALLLLGWFTFGPHLSGRAHAAHERSAQARLQELRGALESAGLPQALQRCATALSATSPELLRVHEVPGDPVARWFLPAWEDDAYLYRLGFPAGGMQATACPRQPTTGNVILAQGEGALSEAPYGGPAPERPSGEALPQAEQQARGRAKAVLSAARQAGVSEAWAAFRQAVGRLAVERVELASEGAVPTPGREVFPVWRAGESWFRLWIVPDPESGGLEPVLFAWPDRPGLAGFAAYRLSNASLRQSRNMAARYAATVSMPVPGAGLRRAGSETDKSGGYTGMDGNRWFEVKR